MNNTQFIPLLGGREPTPRLGAGEQAEGGLINDKSSTGSEPSPTPRNITSTCLKMKRGRSGVYMLSRPTISEIRFFFLLV